MSSSNGFSLDPCSRSDCEWRLEVTGKVETASRCVYLRAKSVALLRRETDEADEPFTGRSPDPASRRASGPFPSRRRRAAIGGLRLPGVQLG